PQRGRKNLDEAFAKQGRQRMYDRGQSVVRDGEFPHFIYRINTGHVHLVRIHEYGREYIIAELGPGDVFGVGTLLEEVPFHYTARVASQTLDCQMLPKEDLIKLMNTDRTVVEALMRLLAKRAMVTSERLVNQAYDSVRRRTALVLCDLQQKYGAVPIELSRDELAQMVGSTKESVIRALSDFRKEGLLTTEGRLIHLKEPVALRGLLV
ncbi:MAG: Crp/Fnr family transcriptional regulator, partial [Bacteroidota bacterium]